MPERLRHHFEPRKGWMNDPNGLIFYKGKYHAFFQHNPYAPRWGRMHWGHAVSDDLLHWEELEIALSPDQPYENSWGCFSGSAVEKDGLLYLFYTSVSWKLGQTQSVAVSGDGVRFEKYAGNPVLQAPADGRSADFRDPKVTKIGGTYSMVCGSGSGKAGRVLLFASENLLDWDYRGVLFEGAQYGPVPECPDFFPLGGHYVLLFSQMHQAFRSTVFVLGGFDGERFTPLSIQRPEIGPHFYAPQTFLAPDGRRVMIGWLNSWRKRRDKGADYAGALTIPRELTLVDGKIRGFPVREAAHLLTPEDKLVRRECGGVSITTVPFTRVPRYRGPVEEISVLRDTKTIEVFINHGEASFSYWFGR